MQTSPMEANPAQTDQKPAGQNRRKSALARLFQWQVVRVVMAWLLLPLIALALKTLGLKRCLRLLEALSPKSTCRKNALHAAASHAVASQAVAGQAAAGQEDPKAALAAQPQALQGKPMELAMRWLAAVDWAASHHLWHMRCLSRSVTGWWLLRWRGCPAALHLGTRRSVEGIEAHAWLELAGTPVGRAGKSAAEFTAFQGPVAGSGDVQA